MATIAGLCLLNAATAASSHKRSCHKRYGVRAGSNLRFNNFTWRRHHLLKLTASPIGCSSSSPPGASDDDDLIISPQQIQHPQNQSMWKKWRIQSKEMSAKMAKLGLSAVLAYGLFDAVTYTTFFVLAFLGYEKSTGKNPAANIKALIGIVILMWTGNNVTRPFRVAGAAALAPAMDKGLNKIRKEFNLPSVTYAFGIVVGGVGACCLLVLGVLILSRWGK
ncbi:hypothetical protein LXL04_018517 [Taraxacum kok-saghyz]